MEYANNSGFTRSTTVTGIAATSYTFPTTPVDGTYYWRIRAVAGPQTVYAGTSGGGAYAFTISGSSNPGGFSSANSFAIIPTFTEWTVILLATGMMGYMIWHQRRRAQIQVRR